MEEEISPLPQSAVQSAYDLYVQKMGAGPSPDEQPTGDQLSSIKHVVSLGAPPYADFALFVPNALRL
eukprot:2813639-Amphidinium_carterae.1